MIFYMRHGRADPKADMEDWGTIGPDLDGCVGFHDTYNSNFNLYFANAEAYAKAKKETGWAAWDTVAHALSVPITEDGLIRVTIADGPYYYGQWGME